jgi:hypothetical protein
MPLPQCSGNQQRCWRSAAGKNNIRAPVFQQTLRRRPSEWEPANRIIRKSQKDTIDAQQPDCQMVRGSQWLRAANETGNAGASTTKSSGKRVGPTDIKPARGRDAIRRKFNGQIDRIWERSSRDDPHVVPEPMQVCCRLSGAN